MTMFSPYFVISPDFFCFAYFLAFSLLFTVFPDLFELST